MTHIKKCFFCFLGAMMLYGTLAAQEPCQKKDWKDLQDVSYETRWDEVIGANLLFPKFGESVQLLEGHCLEISGYVIPMDISGEMIVLSAFPFTNCFFCGGAGPETVMELNLDMSKFKKRFRTDEFHTFRGVLKLNANDIEHLTYILEFAEKVN